MKRKLIGLTGFMNSGKGTVGDYLVSKHGFKTASFANSLKDATAAIFAWPRHLLEGNTKESRIWRETKDEYWSKKLEKDVTPRWVLQHLGTDVLRNHFIDSIWIWSLEKYLGDSTDDIVITDVRFTNEIKLINSLGGKIWWIKRGEMPIWYDEFVVDKSIMLSKYTNVHSSEYDWLGQNENIILDNNKDLEHLYLQIDSWLKI